MRYATVWVCGVCLCLCVGVDGFRLVDGLSIWNWRVRTKSNGCGIFSLCSVFSVCSSSYNILWVWCINTQLPFSTMESHFNDYIRFMKFIVFKLLSLYNAYIPLKALSMLFHTCVCNRTFRDEALINKFRLK